MLTLRDKKILVTGFGGFLGQHVQEYLNNQSADVICAADFTNLLTSGCKNIDLLDINLVKKIFQTIQPEIVLHLAGYNGGINFNIENPADIFFRNTIMGLNVLEAAKQHKIKKVVSITASCGYPCLKPLKDCENEIMYEEDYLDGPPHDSVAPHAYAKRNLQLASKFYNQQYGLNAVCLCPTTLYGPGDTYDLSRTKVMGALIKKIVDAKERNAPEIEMYGSGSARREFIYVKDAAQLICEASLKYNDSKEPLNIGSGQEISIKELVDLICSIIGYNGHILWDKTKPDGQLRKLLDSSKMRAVLGKYQFTSLEDGIKATIEDYKTRFICNNSFENDVKREVEKSIKKQLGGA